MSLGVAHATALDRNVWPGVEYLHCQVYACIVCFRLGLSTGLGIPRIGSVADLQIVEHVLSATGRSHADSAGSGSRRWWLRGDHLPVDNAVVDYDAPVGERLHMKEPCKRARGEISCRRGKPPRNPDAKIAQLQMDDAITFGRDKDSSRVVHCRPPVRVRCDDFIRSDTLQRLQYICNAHRWQVISRDRTDQLLYEMPLSSSTSQSDRGRSWLEHRLHGPFTEQRPTRHDNCCFLLPPAAMGKEAFTVSKPPRTFELIIQQ
nr:hypothetical protein CFP56_31730 [Quercus suber]